jgi:exopolysaccharide production protein ExoZ
MGDSGVDLFFLISGFIMFYAIESSHTNRAWSFLLNRFIRIIPLYWFCTSIFIILLLFIPKIFQTYKFNLWQSIFSYLFLPQSSPPVVSIGWTLVYVMYFYIVLAICLAIGCRSKISWLAIVFTFFYILGLILPSYKIYPVFELMTSELLIEFGFGLLLFNIYQKNVRINMPTVVGIISIGIILFPLLEGLPRLYSYGLPMLFIFGGVVLSRKELLNVTFLHNLGDSSYSIYLVQVFTVPGLGVLIRKFVSYPPPYYLFLLIVFFTVTTLAAAASLYVIIERPITNYLKIRLKKKC